MAPLQTTLLRATAALLVAVPVADLILATLEASQALGHGAPAGGDDPALVLLALAPLGLFLLAAAGKLVLGGVRGRPVAA
ncbi:MAG: hypothetical protein ACPGQL_01910 [Thermoplasmatota archaeon]